MKRKSIRTAPVTLMTVLAPVCLFLVTVVSGPPVTARDNGFQTADKSATRLEISPDRRVIRTVKPQPVHAPAAGTRDAPLAATPAWISTEAYAVGGLRWADMDGDGWLDLVSAHYEGGYPARPEETRVWFNQHGTLESTASWVSTDAVWSTDVTVADVDANGRLDIITVNDGHNVIYFQDAGGISTSPSWTSAESLFSLMSATGDLTGSGFPDIAVVNQGTYTDPYKPNHLYCNISGVPSISACWISGDEAQNMACDLGDFDEDGIIQQTVSLISYGSRPTFTLPRLPIQRITEIRIDGTPVTDWTAHLRNGWIVFTSPPPVASTVAVDLEISDDPDLAVAVDHGNAKVYRDTGVTLESTPFFTVNGTGDRREKGIAWIDVDGDGDLDLFVGGRDVPMLLYENDGGVLNPDASWASDDPEPGCSDIDWIDMDLDGDPDLAVSSTGDSDYDLLWVCENIDGTLETTPSWVIPWSAVQSMCNAVAWGDMNGDGYPDLAAGFAGSEIRVWLNTGAPATPTPNPCPHTGDVTGDTEITSGDAQLAFMIVLGAYTPDTLESCAADCNGDGEITAGDTQQIFLAALGSDTCIDPL